MSGANGRIETGSAVVDGIDTFFRRIGGEGPPVVLVHGVPTHSGEWQQLLTRLKGPALAFDLPGFGRSERPPPERFDYSVNSYAAFVQRLLERFGIEDYSLLVHDWGGLALIGAQDEPARLRRLCVVNAVPLLPGYRWHRTARGWRTPILGELSIRIINKRLLALVLRESRADWSAPDPGFVEMIWEHLDRGTRDAILRLYRSAPEQELAKLGERLGGIDAPALVVWSAKDRYLPLRFGQAYAEVLPNAELLELDDAGHWPWHEREDCLERITEFLDAEPA